MKHNPSEEIYLYKDRWTNGIMTIVLAVCAVYFLIYAINNIVFGAVFLSLFAGITAYVTAKNVFDKTPQLIINAKGIKPAARSLIKWSQIANTVFKTKGSGKYKRQYLQIYSKKRKGPAELIAEIDIYDLGISNNKLETIILRFKRAYRLQKLDSQKKRKENLKGKNRITSKE